MRLEWHEFSVSIPAVDKWLKDNVEGYTGNMAYPDALILGLDGSVTQEQKDSIQAYWDGLTEESDEAVNYMDSQEVAEKRQSLKLAAVSLPWDQMSGIQRKLIANVEVSDKEIIEA